MASKVIVRDIESLSSYCHRLNSLKQELQDTAGKLQALSLDMRNKAVTMHRTTQAQGGNWQDPQYEKLVANLAPCVSAVNAMSQSVDSTAATVQGQMAQIESSITYIQHLVVKLREIS